MRLQSDRRNVTVEPLENRQMLSCVVGTPTNAALSLPPQMMLLIPAGGQFVLPGGQILGPGSYTGASINALLSQTIPASPAAAQITLALDTSTLLRGQNTALVTASVTLADGTVRADGTVHFYTSRPSYDRNLATGETRPCLDEAAKAKTFLGNAAVVNGQAQLGVANLPVGENWVWAQYDSPDGLTNAVSAPATLTVRVPVGLHVAQGSISTLSNLPDIAVTLTDASGQPLGNAGFASPSARGTVQQATASIAFKIPLPPPPPVQSTLLAGITASGTIKLSGGYYDSGTVTGSVCYANSVIVGSGTYSSSGSLTTNNLSSGSVNFLNLGQYFSQWEHVSCRAPSLGGTVTFREGDQILGTNIIGSSAAAVFRPQSLSLGHHTLTVSYAGDAWFVPTDAQTLEFNVTRTPVVVTLATSQAAVLQGRDFSLTATVATAQPDFVVPSGTISIFCDNQLLTTATGVGF